MIEAYPAMVSHRISAKIWLLRASATVDGEMHVSIVDEINELLARATGDALNSWGAVRGLSALRWLIVYSERGVTIEGSPMGYAHAREQCIAAWAAAMDLVQSDESDVWFLDSGGWYVRLV